MSGKLTVLLASLELENGNSSLEFPIALSLSSECVSIYLSGCFSMMIDVFSLSKIRLPKIGFTWLRRVKHWFFKISPFKAGAEFSQGEPSNGSINGTRRRT